MSNPLRDLTRVAPATTGLPPETRPGDFILTHRKAFFSRAIAFGQRLRFRKTERPYAHWTHAALIEDPEKGTIIEALGNGVQRAHIGKYHDVEYIVVHIVSEPSDRDQMVRFAGACVGRPYGYFEIISLGFSLALGGKLAFSKEGTLICSGLVAHTHCRGDAIFPRDPGRMMPADLARYYQVHPDSFMEEINA